MLPPMVPRFWICADGRGHLREHGQMPQHERRSAQVCPRAQGTDDEAAIRSDVDAPQRIQLPDVQQPFWRRTDLARDPDHQVRAPRDRRPVTGREQGIRLGQGSGAGDRRLVRHRSGARRVHDGQVREVPAVEATVPGQESVRLGEGMCANQEIGDHTVAWPAGGPVSGPGRASDDGCLDRHRHVRDSQVLQRLWDRALCLLPSGELGPHDIRCDHRSRLDRHAQSGRGSGTKAVIREQDIDEYAGIDRSDQSSGGNTAGPRMASIIESVSQPSSNFRMP